MSYNLDTGIQSSTCYLDSTNCTSRGEYFTYQLNTGIKCPTGCRLLLSVTSVSLPNVINNVTEYNNEISVKAGSLQVTYRITIPVGIYSAWTFRDFLNTEFVSRSIPVTCIYNVNTFRYQFVSDYAFSIVNLGAHPTTCGSLIGVSKDESNQYIFPVVAGTPFYSLIMPSTINFVATPYIFLKIQNISLTNINSKGNINDTLIRFPVNSEYGQMIQYRPPELNRFLIQKTDINSIQIKLEDIHNRPLSVPSGVELEVILKFDYINTPYQQNYETGTIAHYFKENPITNIEEDLDED